MDPFLWDGYTTAEVNEKIRYWVDLWETLIDDRSDPTVGLDLSNPHLVVREIIDEIIFNHFQNPDNRAFFQRKIEFFIEHDPATQKLFATDLALIRREFGGNRLIYLQKLAQLVDQAYLKSNYLEELYTGLRRHFTDPAWQEGEAEAIKVISQCLIVEFMLKGYSLETIKAFPARIFDRSTQFCFHPGFRRKLNEDDFVKDGHLDIPAYQAAMQTALGGTSLADRLDVFQSYFAPSSHQVFMIYQIEGLKGDDLDITIGNVNLYSPKKKRLIQIVPGGDDTCRQEELFGCSEEACFANAAVLVDDIDIPASEIVSVAAIEKALDFFRMFVHSEIPFKVLSDHFIRVSSNGEYWGMGQRGQSRPDPDYIWFRSVDLTQYSNVAFTDKFLDVAGRLLFDRVDDNQSGQKIAYSLHWYRKAEEADTPEDKLLGYWIVIENIVAVESSDHNVLLPDKKKETKFALVSELVPRFDACLFLANAAANLYRKLVRMMTSSVVNLSARAGRSYLELPHGVASASLLNLPAGSSVNLGTFVTHLQEVADAIPQKMVKDAVLKVHRLHTDIQFAKEVINCRLQAVQDDLLLIYRFRNRIVHNAHYDNIALSYYVSRIRSYAGSLIRQVLIDVCNRREQTIEHSLMRYYVTLGRILEKLDKNIPVDFLNHEY